MNIFHFMYSFDCKNLNKNDINKMELRTDELNYDGLQFLQYKISLRILIVYLFPLKESWDHLLEWIPLQDTNAFYPEK